MLNLWTERSLEDDGGQSVQAITQKQPGFPPQEEPGSSIQEEAGSPHPSGRATLKVCVGVLELHTAQMAILTQGGLIFCSEGVYWEGAGVEWAWRCRRVGQ